MKVFAVSLIAEIPWTGKLLHTLTVFQNVANKDVAEGLALRKALKEHTNIANITVMSCELTPDLFTKE